MDVNCPLFLWVQNLFLSFSTFELSALTYLLLFYHSVSQWSSGNVFLTLFLERVTHVNELSCKIQPKKSFGLLAMLYKKCEYRDVEGNIWNDFEFDKLWLCWTSLWGMCRNTYNHIQTSWLLAMLCKKCEYCDVDGNVWNNFKLVSKLWLYQTSWSRMCRDMDKHIQPS